VRSFVVALALALTVMQTLGYSFGPDDVEA